jgi:hypothetical protein
MTIQEYLIGKVFSDQALTEKEKEVSKQLADLFPEREKLLRKIYRMEDDLDTMRIMLKRQFI